MGSEQRPYQESDQQFGDLFDELWQAHYGDVYGYCYRRTSSRADAEDATADVFVAAWRHIDEIPETESPIAWLYGTARKVLANRARGRRRALMLIDRLRTRSSPRKPVDFAERVTSALDAEQTAKEILASLDPVDREILRLTAWEGLSQAEVGRALGMEAGTVRTRTWRIRKAISGGRESRGGGPK